MPDGTHQETSTDSEGNTTTRTVQDYSNINVHLTFNAGKIVIRSEDDSNIWSAGFAPELNYHDGHGSAIKPRTGEVFHASNEAATLGSEQLGYSAGHGDFTLTGGTRIAMIIDENGALLSTGRATWRREVVQYRQGLAAKRVATEATLSSAFYLFVYQNDTATRAQIERFFPVCEARGHLAALPVQHKEGLDFAFGRMAFARSGPCAGVWCLFWCDRWACNKALPSSPPPCCSTPRPGTPRTARCRARSSSRCSTPRASGSRPSKDWVNSAILDLLYESVARRGRDPRDADPHADHGDWRAGRGRERGAPAEGRDRPSRTAKVGLTRARVGGARLTPAGLKARRRQPPPRFALAFPPGRRQRRAAAARSPVLRVDDHAVEKRRARPC